MRRITDGVITSRLPTDRGLHQAKNPKAGGIKIRSDKREMKNGRKKRRKKGNKMINHLDCIAIRTGVRGSDAQLRYRLYQ